MNMCNSVYWICLSVFITWMDVYCKHYCLFLQRHTKSCLLLSWQQPVGPVGPVGPEGPEGPQGEAPLNFM